MPDSSCEPFQLLALPPELQLKICEKHLEDADSTVWEQQPVTEKPTTFACVPSLAIEQTCHQLCADVRNVRERIFPRTLKITSSNGFDVYCLGDIVRGRRYRWLRQRITALVVRGTDNMGWNRAIWPKLVDACPQLTYVDLSLTWLFYDRPGLAANLYHGIQSGQVRWVTYFSCLVQSSGITDLSKLLCSKHGDHYILLGNVRLGTVDDGCVNIYEKVSCLSVHELSRRIC